MAHINNEKDKNLRSNGMKLPANWMHGTSAHQKPHGEYFIFPYLIVHITSYDWQSIYHEKSLSFFMPGQEENALIRVAMKDTTLTAYFKLNHNDPNARQ
jgi:hypothetical protein